MRPYYFNADPFAKETPMTVYEIAADTASTFALRNKATGQFDHSGFPTKALIRSFFALHFGWNPSYRLEG